MDFVSDQIIQQVISLASVSEHIFKVTLPTLVTKLLFIVFGILTFTELKDEGRVNISLLFQTHSTTHTNTTMLHIVVDGLIWRQS